MRLGLTPPVGALRLLLLTRFTVFRGEFADDYGGPYREVRRVSRARAVRMRVSGAHTPHATRGARVTCAGVLANLRGADVVARPAAALYPGAE